MQANRVQTWYSAYVHSKTASNFQESLQLDKPFQFPCQILSFLKPKSQLRLQSSCQRSKRRRSFFVLSIDDSSWGSTGIDSDKSAAHCCPTCIFVVAMNLSFHICFYSLNFRWIPDINRLLILLFSNLSSTWVMAFASTTTSRLPS
jgi:hypothetical protein